MRRRGPARLCHPPSSSGISLAGSSPTALPACAAVPSAMRCYSPSPVKAEESILLARRARARLEASGAPPGEVDRMHAACTKAVILRRDVVEPPYA